MKRIKGVTARIVYNGRIYDVVFKSPYRWRVYNINGNDITKEMMLSIFGINASLRGETIEGHSENWEKWHRIVTENTISQKLDVE